MIICFMAIVGVGFFWRLHMNKENIKKEKQQLSEVVKMEKIAAEQVKNTYSGLKKIDFDKDYSYDSMTGFTLVNVTVSTDSVSKSNFSISMTLNDKENENYVGSIARPKLQNGKTESLVKVIYSDGSIGEQ